MTGQFRQIVGLCLIVVGIFILFEVLTLLSRSRLAEAQEQSEYLYRQEAALMARWQDAQRSNDNQFALPSSYIWPGQQRAELEVGFQQVLIDAAENAGLRLVSFGPGRPPEDINTPALGYEIEIEGGHEQLARLLLQIETNEPQLGYSYLWVRQQGAAANGSEEAMISARIGVWGFIEAPTEMTVP